MDDKTIRDFFANLTPDQFVNDSSFHTRAIPVGATFDGFLDEHMDVLRLAYAACDGNIYPIASIATDTAVHYFKSTDEETLGDFTQRVAEFSAAHNSQWLFIFKKVKVHGTDGDRVVVYWLAGEREPDLSVRYRQGFLETLDQILGDCVETPADEQPEGFRTILEGHST